MIHLTPAMIEATYELLRTVPPFRGWKLPESDEIQFEVTRHLDRYADYRCVDKRHILRVSQRTVGQLPTLVIKVAHEMVHLELELRGRQTSDHGAAFKAAAKRVCDLHGFDPLAF